MANAKQDHNLTYEDGFAHGYEAHRAEQALEQPKEPQYLYAYHTTKGIELGYAPHEGINMYNTKIVGKIKLESDNGN